MLPYTRQYFEELLTTGRIRCIRPSDTVYESRKNFGESQLGTPLAAKKLGGFRLLQGSGQFSGEILGGCIDSIFDMFDPSRYAAGNTGCSRQKRNGGAGSCCSSRARNRWRPRNTKRRWNT